MPGRKSPLATIAIFYLLIAACVIVAGCTTTQDTSTCSAGFDLKNQSCFGETKQNSYLGSGTDPVTFTHLEDAIAKTCNGCPDICTTAVGKTICAGSCSGPSCSGGSSTANYTAVLHQKTPSRDGSSTLLSITAGPERTDFLDDLFWVKVGPHNIATHFIYDLRVWPDDNSLNAKALEFDLVQYVSGTRYDFSSQCVYHCTGQTCYWQVWDPTTPKGWVNSELACEKFAPGSWHHIVWEYRTHPDTKQTEYLTLTIDNVSHPINLKKPAGTTKWGDNLLIQIQQDTRPLPQNSFSQWVDEVSLTFW